jgi:hypothetical protein
LAISEPGDPPAAFRGEPGSASGKVESIVDARRLLTINTGSSSLKVAARVEQASSLREIGESAFGGGKVEIVRWLCSVPASVLLRLRRAHEARS